MKREERDRIRRRNPERQKNSGNWESIGSPEKRAAGGIRCKRGRKTAFLSLFLIFCVAISAPGNAFAVQENSRMTDDNRITAETTAGDSAELKAEERESIESSSDTSESSCLTEDEDAGSSESRGEASDGDSAGDSGSDSGSGSDMRNGAGESQKNSAGDSEENRDDGTESSDEMQYTVSFLSGISEEDVIFAGDLPESFTVSDSEEIRLPDCPVRVRGNVFDIWICDAEKECRGHAPYSLSGETFRICDLMEGTDASAYGCVTFTAQWRTAKSAQITLYPDFYEEADGSGDDTGQEKNAGDTESGNGAEPGEESPADPAESAVSDGLSALKDAILAANAENSGFDAEAAEFTESEDGKAIIITGLYEGETFLFPEIMQSGRRFSGWKKVEKTSFLQRMFAFFFGGDAAELSAIESDGDSADENPPDGDATDEAAGNGGSILITSEDEEEVISLTYAAQWQKLFSVSYEKNSDTEIGEAPEGQKYAYAAGESFEVASADGLTKTGFTFAGWKDNLTGAVYKAGDIYTLPEKEAAASDVVFKPQWKTIYALTFYASEGEPGGEFEGEFIIENPVNHTEYAAEQETVSLPEQGEMSVEGYHFLGWKDSSGKQYKPGAAYLVTGNETFTGVWAKAYSVTFERGGIDEDDTAVISGDDPEPVSAAVGETIILPENPYTVITKKNGTAYYLFTGWKAARAADNGGDTEDSGEGETDEEDSGQGDAEEKGSGERISEEADSADGAENGDVIFPAESEYEVTEEGNLIFTAQWKAMSSGSVWDGSRSSQPVSGSGTASDPYLIQTAAELAWLAEYTNDGNNTQDQYFSLEEDLDLSGLDWAPIGICDSEATADGGGGDGADRAGMFQGTFLGNGHTIYHLSIKVGVSGAEDGTQTGNTEEENDESGAAGGTTGADGETDLGAALGIFGAVGAQGSIEALHLSDAAVTVRIGADSAASDSICAGVVAGYTTGNISECTVSGSLTYIAGSGAPSDPSACLGGIAGRAAGGSITNCESAAAVSAAGGSYMLGGIAGDFSGVQIADCKNTGILAEGAAAVSSGTASAASSKAVSTALFAAGERLIGGIAGRYQGIEALSECINTGRLQLSNSSSYAETDSGTGSEGQDSSAGSGDSEDGSKSVSNADSAVRAGGIAGLLHTKIEYCFNLGTINIRIDLSVSSSLSGTKAQIGGIAGMISGSGAEITDCYSYARLVDFSGGSSGVTADDILNCAQIGGIVGDVGTETVAGESSGAGTGIGASVTNCCWLIDDAAKSAAGGAADAESAGGADTGGDKTFTADGTIIVPTVADGSGQIANANGATQNGNVLEGKTASQFASGEAAYLLDGGQYPHRNVWTQGVINNESLPVLGSPSLYRVTAGGNSGVTLSSGGAFSAELYVSEGTIVSLSVDSLNKEVTIGEPYESYRTTVGDTTTIYYYQKYYDTAYVQVEYSDFYGTEEDITDLLEFEMKDCDARIGAAFITDESQLGSSPIRTKFHHLEIITEESTEQPEKPEETKTNSGGGKNSNSDKNNEKEGRPGTGTNPNGNSSGGSGGTGEYEPVSALPDPAALEPWNDPANMVQIAIPAVTETITDVPEEAPQEMTEDSEASPPLDNDYEKSSEEAEEAAEESAGVTVFEVIQNTLKANPLAAGLLFFAVIALLIVGGGSRYRRNRED